MENLTRGDTNINAIIVILPEAAEAMAVAERWLRSRDQVKLLTGAVEDVLNRAEREMALAHLDYQIRSESAFRAQTVGMLLDLGTMLMSVKGQVPSKREIKTPSMPRVVIVVGPEGIPVDMSVVNVSELADRVGEAEDWVERKFEEDGNMLLPIEGFKELASWLQIEVLSGTTFLPYHPATVGPQKPVIMFSKPKSQLPS
jgi:hypothetical protein